MNFTQDQYLIIGAIALAAFSLGAIIAWATTASSAKSKLAKISAEKAAETSRLDETKLRLASTQKDLQAIRDAKLDIQQELESLHKIMELNKQISNTQKSLVSSVQSIDDQLKDLLGKSDSTSPDPEHSSQSEQYIEPTPGDGDFADFSSPRALSANAIQNSEFEGFTADSEGAGI